MTISRPELDLTYPPKLSMFCTEERVDRELCWAGFGFQVWLQILTHLTNSADADILVVDVREARGTIPHFHILAGKEIENYLLVPSAIMRAIEDRLKDQRSTRVFTRPMLDELISTVVDQTRSSVLSQYVSNRMRYFDHRTHKTLRLLPAKQLRMLIRNGASLTANS